MTAATSRTDLRPSGKANPCPICTRSHDGDCRIGSDLILCHHGTTHHPPEGLKPGDIHPGIDGQQWALTGDTSDGRAAVFTLHKPRTERWSEPPRSEAPSFSLARLPFPGIEPPAHWPDQQRLSYGPDQWVVVEVALDGQKAHKPWHRNASGRAIKQKGPAPWPLWCEAEVLQHGPGRWISEAEGEKCAGWLRAGGLVSTTQPGHDHTPASIEARYRRIKAAGIAGVAYLSDNDTTGAQKAERCANAAAAVGLAFRTVAASAIWPDLPRGGSVDDASGSAAERAAAFEAAAGQVAAALHLNGVTPPPARDEKRHRLAADEVLELLPRRVEGIRLNIRSRAIETASNTLNGDQIGRLYLQLSSRAESWPKEATVDAVMELAHQNAYDPVAEYLDGLTAEPLPLEQWQRLDQHLLGIDDPIAATFLPRYLISAVARTFQPGCGVRQTPVIIGPQWRGKTALGRILFGADHWVEGLHGRNEVDQRTRCHTAWGVELSELDGISRRADQEALKAFLTERVDILRRAYGKGEERLPRRFVFWATSNGPPLRDSTGSTRFVGIPIPDRMLPLEWAVANRDAIWARALEQYRAGVDWDACSEEERTAIAERNEDFTEVDPWADAVLRYLEQERRMGSLPVQLPAVLSHLGIPVERHTNATAKRARQLVEAAGWRHRRQRRGEKRPQGFWPPESSAGGGHPGHPVATPGGVRVKASPEAGFTRPGHPGHTESVLRGFQGDENPVGGSTGPVNPAPTPIGVSGVSNPRKSTALQGKYADSPGVATGCPSGCPEVPEPPFEVGEAVEVRDAWRNWSGGYVVTALPDADGLVKVRSRTGRELHVRLKSIRRPPEQRGDAPPDPPAWAL